MKDKEQEEIGQMIKESKLSTKCAKVNIQLGRAEREEEILEIIDKCFEFETDYYFVKKGEELKQKIKENKSK